MDLEEELEAGVENVKITLKSSLDLYIGKVYETDNILCAIKRIDKVTIKDGLFSCDVVVQPLHRVR